MLTRGKITPEMGAYMKVGACKNDQELVELAMSGKMDVHAFLCRNSHLDLIYVHKYGYKPYVINIDVETAHALLASVTAPVKDVLAYYGLPWEKYKKLTVAELSSEFCRRQQVYICREIFRITRLIQFVERYPQLPRDTANRWLEYSAIIPLDYLYHYVQNWPPENLPEFYNAIMNGRIIDEILWATDQK
jgi:hypothetical protein